MDIGYSFQVDNIGEDIDSQCRKWIQLVGIIVLAFSKPYKIRQLDQLPERLKWNFLSQYWQTMRWNFPTSGTWVKQRPTFESSPGSYITKSKQSPTFSYFWKNLQFRRSGEGRCLRIRMKEHSQIALKMAWGRGERVRGQQIGRRWSCHHTIFDNRAKGRRNYFESPGNETRFILQNTNHWRWRSGIRGK